MFEVVVEFQPDEARLGLVDGEVDAAVVRCAGSGLVSKVGKLGSKCCLGVCVAVLAFVVQDGMFL